MPQRISRQTAIKLTALLALTIACAGAVALWDSRHDLQRGLERAALPETVEYQQDNPSPAVLPAEVNLAVPFTAQAPHGNWEPPYKEFCEEASVLMAISYVRNQSISSADSAQQQMLAIKTFEDERFGYYEDTTAAETATILRDYYEYDKVQLKENPTADDIKRALAGGQLVIVPAAGRNLGNPYFQQPGPLYHMFVVKGYTATGKFIVNDPGTRRGADFLYGEDVVMNAMHDWRPDGDIERGRKVILIVG